LCAELGQQVEVARVARVADSALELLGAVSETQEPGQQPSGYLARGGSTQGHHGSLGCVDEPRGVVPRASEVAALARRRVEAELVELG
jgi:hypothetical protein